MSNRLFLFLLFAVLLSGTALGQADTHVAQVGTGQGFETSFNFMNLSSTTSRVSVQVFDNSGDPLPILSLDPGPFGDPFGAAETGLEIAGLGSASLATFPDPDVLVGYAVVQVDQGAVGFEVVFRRFDGSGVLVTTTSVLPEPLTQAFSFVAFSNSFANSGIALLNPVENGVTANLEVEIYNNQGNLIGIRGVALPPGEKIARFINEDELFPELAGQQFTGSVEVRSDLPVAVTIIKLEGNQGFFTTQTVQPAREIE